jgi:glycosyltransferase involved in cell wall biosynthesis
LGLPVVTARNAAIAHYFSETDCLFYNPDKPDSLPELLARIADNPGILVEFRERAVAIREQFLWSVEKRRYVSVLCELARIPVPYKTQEAEPVLAKP